jgi:hypothetical protein
MIRQCAASNLSFIGPEPSVHRELPCGVSEIFPCNDGDRGELASQMITAHSRLWISPR